MSDVDQGQEAVGSQGRPIKLVSIPITKAKGLVEIDVNNDVPDDVYAEALVLGLKELANRGMTKITKASTKDEAELKSLAMAQANRNVEAIKASKIRFSGKKSDSKMTGEVKTEAMRLAKNIVKDLMKKAGLKISHTPASEITAAAKEVLDADASIIATATANIEARKKKSEGGVAGIDISKLVKADPKLVAKDEAKKAKEKAEKPMSKTQAGKVKPRAKPQAQTNA